jgi:hypothetical protein
MDIVNSLTISHRLRSQSPADYPAKRRTGDCPDLQSIHRHGSPFSSFLKELPPIEDLLRRGYEQACQWARDCGIDVERQTEYWYCCSCTLPV